MSEIRIDTRLHPQTVSIYLKRLKKEGLIDIKTAGWKRGKSKPCSITKVGIARLVDISFEEPLQVLSEIIRRMKGTEIREIFRKVNEERFSRNRKIIGDYFVERLLKKDESPMQYPEGLDLTDPDQPFREILKKMLALHLYLESDPLRNSEDPEVSIEKDFILFGPRMTFAFSWHPGAFPALEQEIRRADSCFRSKPESLTEHNVDTVVSKETHLLGLDKVDERYFREYLRAKGKASRERIMAKIERDAGWSVGSYLGKLLIGRKAEIDKYVDARERPFLREFISLFENFENK